MKHKQNVPLYIYQNKVIHMIRYLHFHLKFNFYLILSFTYDYNYCKNENI